jgi:hypothetical protein
MLSYFSIVNSVIFCYNELSHFVIVLGNFMILSTILEILSDILLQWLVILSKIFNNFSELCNSSCYSAQPFSLLQCLVVLTATMLRHSSFIIVLSHSSLLHYHEVDQPFYKMTERGGPETLSYFIK